MEPLELTQLQLTKLYNTEFAQLLVRFFEDFSKSGINVEDDADFKKLYDEIKEDLEKYSESLNQVRASEISSEIAKADKSRDFAYKAFSAALSAYKYSEVEAEKEAYRSLMLVVSEFKGIDNLAYEASTFKFNAFSDRFQSSEYKNHLNTLSLTKFVQRIASANQKFNELFAKRSGETMQKPVYNSAEIRKRLFLNYKKLCSYISSLAQVKQDEYYKKSLVVINNGRKYFADTILSRRQSPSKALKKALKEEKE